MVFMILRPKNYKKPIKPIKRIRYCHLSFKIQSKLRYDQNQFKKTGKLITKKNLDFKRINVVMSLWWCHLLSDGYFFRVKFDIKF